MDSERLPRFKRTSIASHLELTTRDHAIIRQVHRHRYLRSWQIIALVGGSPQQILRRLRLLYHHEYLDRPRSQINYFQKGGSHHMVYGLGKGATKVLTQYGVTSSAIRCDEKDGRVGRIFLDHELLVSDIIVAIELACRKDANIRLLHIEDLTLPKNVRLKSQPFCWKVKVKGTRLTAVPDYIFALDWKDANGACNRIHFFLEADRGTMPVIRRNLLQTSFYKKLIAYEATWNQNIHRRRFGFDRIRILTITTIPGRVNSLAKACSQLKTGHGLFLFADTSILAGNILHDNWQTGKPGLTGRLVE